MKLAATPDTQEGAALHLEAFADRVRCGRVKRYAIVSLESDKDGPDSSGFFVQHYSGVTTLIEDLAFVTSMDLLKDSIKSEVNCGQDDD